MKIHQHSQRTLVELDGPYGPIQIESSTTVTVDTVEDDPPSYQFDDGFSNRRRDDCRIKEAMRRSKIGAPCSPNAIIRSSDR